MLDLLMLYVSVGESGTAAGADAQYVDTCEAVAWVDELVRHVNAQPGIRDGLLLAVLLSSGGALLPTGLLQPGGTGSGGIGSADTLRPRQSWQLREDKPVAIDAGAPILAVQRLPAVVRVDACSALSLAQCAARGGNGAIQAERLIPELAYKLGRAPKYGA